MLDPANGIDRTADLALAGGRVAALADRIDPRDAAQVYDAAGQVVTPGLVDLHVHAYHLVTPLGMDVDHYCLGRGVTTAVDAGSAGCSTFPGYRGFLAERSRTRLLAFLNISCSGLAFAGLAGDEAEFRASSTCFRWRRFAACIDCIEANRDLIVGVKIRLSDSCTAEGRTKARRTGARARPRLRPGCL